MTAASPILPGATLGILGGGQLGRMTAMAARSLGYHIHVLDPDPSCAARFVVESCVTAPFDDPEAARRLAQKCAVVTIEIEKIALASLEAAQAFAPVRPGAKVLGIIQDRIVQKGWLAENGFPVGPHAAADTEAALASAVRGLGPRAFVKSARGGYDGRGQVVVKAEAEVPRAWRELGTGPVVVEQGLSLQQELSVLVARRPSGETVAYPPALNHHVQGILEWSVLPGPIDPRVAERAMRLGVELAEALGVEGLLVTEFFLTTEGKLYVNEMAPRPHNTFHTTEVACVTSQFEQAVRAVCDLPLGAPDVVRPGAIVNLLGDLWVGDASPRFDAALAVPGVGVHLYGKRVARPGRKMGHLSAVGQTPEEALARVREAMGRLGRG